MQAGGGGRVGKGVGEGGLGDGLEEFEDGGVEGRGLEEEEGGALAEGRG